MTKRLFLPILALVLSAGCNAASSMCREASNCSGVDEGLSECLDGADASADQARDAGCNSEYNAMNSCLHRNSTCDGEIYSIRLAECDSQVGTYAECLIGAAF